MPVQCTCQTCGSVFSLPPSAVRNGEGKYCSRACYHASYGTPEQRFWAHVERGDGCWLWQGPIGRGGYGITSYNGRTHSAHRVAWILTNGPIPDGLDCLHDCDVRRCCKPAHLFLGTHQDNMTDMVNKGRSLRGDASPSRQHPERVKRGEQHVYRLHPERHVRGERARSAKLTEPDVRAIRSLYTTGDATMTDLAARFGVTHGTVYALLTGRTWKHVA